MDNNDNFSFTYSAQQQKEVEEIRKKYLPKEEDSVKVSTESAQSGKGHTKTPLQTIRFARLKHFQQHLSHR